jgi:hypothetical protein
MTTGKAHPEKADSHWLREAFLYRFYPHSQESSI